MDTRRTVPLALPETAVQALRSWRELRAAAGGALPTLSDLAPGGLAPSLLPWTMTIQRDAARRLVYGVVGERTTESHKGNPRGKPFMYDTPPQVAADRIAVVHRALDTGAPFWVVSRGVRANDWMHFARLGLPTRAATGEVLLVVVFRIAKDEAPAEDGEHLEWLAADER
jgi:hypothetical protein